MKEKKRVLVVDDMETIRQSLYSHLSGEGFEVNLTKSGEEALVAIETTPPDVIVMDIIMGGMTGIECCRQIKQKPSTRGIPVIILTSLGKHEQKRQAFAAGCDSYLTKPVNKEKLIGKIWLLTNLKRN
jgi:CheY-like chemotaxis protein